MTQPFTPQFVPWLQSTHPEISARSAEAVLRLAAEGATIPFIARYRKEQTGNLDEVGIQNVVDFKERWDQILSRQEYIVGEIEKQGKLTPELKEKILGTFHLNQLEDLYLPYKLKRKTKAALAREAGLEPLADWIWNCGHGTEAPQPGQTLELWAFTFRNTEKGFDDAERTTAGAQDILVERLSELQELRQLVRTTLFEKGQLRAGKAEKAKPNSKYENYFTYHESVQSLMKPENSHRYLAIRRGWIEEELTLSLGGVPDGEDLEGELLKIFEMTACTVADSPGAAVLQKAARLALKAHVLPSIENEVHKTVKEVADQVAIQVFAENVRKLLLASPFGSKAVLGVDPGVRTGCKLAVVDDSGKYLASTVIYLQTDDQKEVAKKTLIEVMRNAPIRAVAVGNGTAGRETEIFIRACFKEAEIQAPVAMVSESGASVYSASEAARDEFPELDVTIRGAISIARRLQDPLAELVKIDPKSIGVGQYQHDVSPMALKRSLDFVVDSCVNAVGVNLNTASYHLLAHVSGIGEMLAKAIVEHRGTQGLFKSRAELLEVPRFSTKAFEQAAGFLRISGAENPLDNTGIHPERYGVLESVAQKMGKAVRDLMGSGVGLLKQEKQLREEVGAFTFDDMVRELEKPGRDPRDEFVPFSFRDDIFELKDLKPEMICPGIVTNVTNFGAFVDIGVHQDGLVHLSQLSDRFVKDPQEVVSPGDRVTVKVLGVNLEKNQISLSMKLRDASRERAARPAREPRPESPSGNGRRDRPQNGPSGGKVIQAKNGDRPVIPPVQRGAGRPEKKPIRPPKPAFKNNAFAGLAALKDNLKK